MKNLFICLSIFIVCILGYILCSCTYSINMVHTEGTASDVVDEDQAASPNVAPNLTIPASVL